MGHHMDRMMIGNILYFSRNISVLLILTVVLMLRPSFIQSFDAGTFYPVGN